MNASGDLVFFCEGSDDVLFIETIIVPIASKSFDKKMVHETACLKDDKVSAFIQTYRRNGYKIVFLVDQDNTACLLDVVNRVTAKFPLLNKDDVYVVQREIESWYMAGCKEANCEKLRIPHFAKPDETGKADMAAAAKAANTSSFPLMSKLMGCYSVPHARSRCRSFNRLHRDVVR